MAEQISQDVVKDAQSMSTSVPIDDTAKPSKTTPAGNGNHSATSTTLQENPTIETPALSSIETSTNDSESSAIKDEVLVRRHDLSQLHTLSNDYLQPPSVSLQDLKDGGRPLEDVKSLLLNGDSANQSASEDATGDNPANDVSGGSDTDTSRELADAVKDASGRHTRSNSTKKPTSFKSVSVTKNFLAKTAVSTPLGKNEKGRR